MRIYFQLSFLLLLGGSIISGCSSSRNSSRPTCLTLPDTIIVSSGGGFSGFYNFYSITSGGAVKSWQQRSGTMRDTVFSEKTISCDSVAFYFQFLDKIDFASINYSSNGNMNYKVERRTGGKNHSVSWGNSDPLAPKEVMVAYTLLTHAAKQWAEPASK